MRAALAYRKFERCKYTVFFLNAKQFSYFSSSILHSFLLSQYFVTCLVVAYQFLVFEVAHVRGGSGAKLQQVEFALPDFCHKVCAVAFEVIGAETVAVSALGVAVLFVEPCGEVCPTEIMPAIGLVEWLYLAARYAAEGSARHTVAQPDVKAKLFVELCFQVGFLLDLDACPIEEWQVGGLLFLGFSFEVVWHKLMI